MAGSWSLISGQATVIPYAVRYGQKKKGRKNKSFSFARDRFLWKEERFMISKEVKLRGLSTEFLL